MNENTSLRAWLFDFKEIPMPDCPDAADIDDIVHMAIDKRVLPVLDEVLTRLRCIEDTVERIKRK